jgi:hypothetical protein
LFIHKELASYGDIKEELPNQSEIFGIDEEGL